MKYEMKPAGLVVFIAFIVVGIIDLGFVVFGGTGTTISAFMVDAGLRSPFWVLVFGIVVGHLVFGMKAVCSKCAGKENDRDEARAEVERLREALAASIQAFDEAVDYAPLVLAGELRKEFEPIRAALKGEKID